MSLRNEHYLQYIKDQDEIALTTHVLKLQKENRRFVHQLEHKQLGKIPSLTEKDCETIQRYRWYLEDTLLALKNLGSDYMFTKSEQKAFAFQKNVPKITRVGFYIGGYLGGIEKYEIEINEDEALMSYSLSDTHSVPPIIVMEPDHLCKEEFFRFIHSIHMGEWKKAYINAQKDDMFYDNIIWRVEIFYADGLEKVTFGGFNAFPYNFEQFLNFFKRYKRKVYTL